MLLSNAKDQAATVLVARTVNGSVTIERLSGNEKTCCAVVLATLMSTVKRSSLDDHSTAMIWETIIPSDVSAVCVTASTSLARSLRSLVASTSANFAHTSVPWLLTHLAMIILRGFKLRKRCLWAVLFHDAPLMDCMLLSNAKDQAATVLVARTVNGSVTIERLSGNEKTCCAVVLATLMSTVKRSSLDDHSTAMIWETIIPSDVSAVCVTALTSLARSLRRLVASTSAKVAYTSVRSASTLHQ